LYIDCEKPFDSGLKQTVVYYEGEQFKVIIDRVIRNNSECKPKISMSVYPQQYLVFVNAMFREGQSKLNTRFL